MEPPRMTITAMVLDSPDASELAAFYRRLLGWAAVADEPGWVKLRAGRLNRPFVPDRGGICQAALACELR